jgi:hypothetical protein
VQARPTPFTVTHPRNRRTGDFEMNQKEHITAKRPGPITSAGSWSMRYRGLAISSGVRMT